MPSPLLNDHKHLLTCLELKQRADVPDDPVSLSSEAWETVYRQSVKHAVTPLLYDRLTKADAADRVPREMRDRCRRVYLTALGRNLRLYFQLSQLLRRLNAEKIPVIVLKGAHLAEKVYGNIGLRTFGDVDLLFQEKDLPRCREILFGRSGRARSNRLLVDIQWNIDLSAAELPINVKEIWARSIRTDIGGVDTRVLCHEDLLIHLCLHPAFHHQYRFMGLRSLCDIAEVIRRHGAELDWKALVDRAVTWRVGYCVNVTLALCRDLLKVRVPDHVMDALRPDDSGRVYDWAIGQIFSEQEASSGLSPYFWQMYRPGHSAEKLAHLRHLIFPGAEFVLQKYAIPDKTAKNVLYYAVRAKDHIGRYGKAMAGLLRKDPHVMAEAQREIENLTMMEWLSKK